MKRLKYRIKKLIFLLTIKFQSFLTALFYKNNINSDFQSIINKNRSFLKTIDHFLPKEIYENNDYGVQQRIYQKLDYEIVHLPTYSDLISFLITKIFKNKVSYLEIGVSVLKNFLQINNIISNSNLIAYDINEINPQFKDLDYFSKNGNNLKYFQGSVLDEEDANDFKKLYSQTFDFIFSDALHTPDAIRSEYDLIIKNRLSENFIIYYDDLDFEGIEDEFRSIKLEISKEINKEVNFYTFFIYGWIGQHENLHKNGIITNLNLEDIFKKEEIKIYKFMKM
mgnify:CR=1 FL=1